MWYTYLKCKEDKLYMKKTNREGISLIVLVITIIVMLILVSAVILKLKDSYNY